MRELNIMGHDTPPLSPSKGTAPASDGAGRRGLRCRAVAALCLVMALQGCATGAWYLQSMSGHLQLMGARQGIATALNNATTTPETRARLAQLPDLLEFATTELGLPDNGSYRSYVQLDRPYVAWNVFAAPPLSLEAKRWCYPVTGCLAYRGYFSEDAAHAEAATLAAAGADVYVGGVTAYSTLGWFRDPVTSPMLRGDRYDIATVLFHELAHQVAWLDGDTELNEAFAETVARIGVERLAAREGMKLPAEYLERSAGSDRFFALVLGHRRALQALYDSDLPDGTKLERKARILDRLRQEYHAGKQNPRAPAPLDAWVDSELNNAKLAAVSSYRELVPGLMAVYGATCRDLETFFARVRQLAGCTREARHRWVRAGGGAPACWMSHRGSHNSERIHQVAK
jgi:predicted aminopeptidase